MDQEKKWLEEIKRIAREAGDIFQDVTPHREDSLSKEGHANFVTRYDQQVQRFLMQSLTRLMPEAHFVGEENGQEIFEPSYGQGYTFVVDPIDGTSNFLKGYRPSVVSIGVLKDGRPHMGVIYSPYTRELFWAMKGLGAYCNEDPIRQSASPLSESLVSMGTAPYYEEEVSHSAFEVGFHYLRRSIDIRRCGSAAYDLCLVAQGRCGLFFEPRLCLWDYMAGAVIVEEAGGVVTDMKGAPLSYRGKSSVLAATGAVAKEDYLPPAELLPKSI